MSYTTRDKYKRRFDMIKGNLDTAIAYLAEFEMVYREHHRDLSDYAIAIANMINQTKEFIDTLQSNL